ncbi:hypothetical protein DITRI_Ditri09bG0012700 [Diplodiscus trichospermus]
MYGLVERASNGSSRLKFATGMADVDSERIYALMQCTTDISKENCTQCLTETVDRYQRCCHGRQGGYVLTPSCLFQWYLYPFFRSSADTLYLEPPPPPSPLHSATNTNTNRADNGGLESQAVLVIIVSIIISTAILGSQSFNFRVGC